MGNGLNLKPKIPEFDKSEKEEIPDIGGDYKKPGSIRNVVFKKTNTVIESSGSDFCYLIFVFEEIKKEFGLDTENILTLMYLEELGLFESEVIISGRKIRLGIFIRKDMVTMDYSNNDKNIYKLAPKGFEVLKFLKDTLRDCDSFIGQNRIHDLQTDDKIRSTLSGYFSLGTSS